MQPLANYFTWDEVTRSAEASRRGIDNTLPASLLPNVKYTASKMDYVRTNLSTPVLVSSWYRCIALNRLIGSRDTSDHIQGLAVDFISPSFGTPLEICRYLLQYQGTIKWKQLILEYDWVHISFYSSPEIQKLPQVLTLLYNGHYALGLTDKYGKVV